jgi:hypothetical protein
LHDLIRHWINQSLLRQVVSVRMVGPFLLLHRGTTMKKDTKNWPSGKSAKPSKSTPVKYDPGMGIMAPTIKKASGRLPGQRKGYNV